MVSTAEARSIDGFIRRLSISNAGYPPPRPPHKGEGAENHHLGIKAHQSRCESRRRFLPVTGDSIRMCEALTGRDKTAHTRRKQAALRETSGSWRRHQHHPSLPRSCV